MDDRPPPLHVFVLAGQSNMAGRGGVQRMSDGCKAWDGLQPDAYQGMPACPLFSGHVDTS